RPRRVLARHHAESHAAPRRLVRERSHRRAPNRRRHPRCLQHPRRRHNCNQNRYKFLRSVSPLRHCRRPRRWPPRLRLPRPRPLRRYRRTRCRQSHRRPHHHHRHRLPLRQQRHHQRRYRSGIVLDIHLHHRHRPAAVRIHHATQRSRHDRRRRSLHRRLCHHVECAHLLRLHRARHHDPHRCACRHTPHRHANRLRHPHNLARWRHSNRRPSRRLHLDRPRTSLRLQRLTLHHRDRLHRPRFHLDRHNRLRRGESHRLCPRPHTIRRVHSSYSQRLRASAHDLHRSKFHRYLDSTTLRIPELRARREPRSRLDGLDNARQRARLLHLSGLNRRQLPGHRFNHSYPRPARRRFSIHRAGLRMECWRQPKPARALRHLHRHRRAALHAAHRHRQRR